MAVALTAALAWRFTVEVAPTLPSVAVAPDRTDLIYPTYSDIATFGESRFLHPSVWATRPVSFELWSVYRSVVYALLPAGPGATTPNVNVKFFVYWAWFVFWLMATAWAGGVYLRSALDAKAASYPFSRRLLVILGIVYVYSFWCPAPNFVPYDLVAVVVQLLVFALILTFRDKPSWRLLALMCLSCVFAVYLKETLILGFGALALVIAWEIKNGERRPLDVAAVLGLVLACVAAWQLQLVYMEHVVGVDFLKQRVLTNSRFFVLNNLYYLTQIRPGPGGIQSPLFMLAPLVLVLTRFYRPFMPPQKDRVMRLSVLMFLVVLMIIANPRESRILVEFVLIAYLFRPFERLSFRRFEPDRATLRAAES